MHRKSIGMAVLALFVFSLSAVAAGANGSEYAGTWGGNWEGGGGAGRFDLTLTAGADGQVSGGVSVGSETGDYTAKFSSFSIAGNKLSARYTYPPEEQAEIVLTATFEGGKATGTWTMVQKGQDTAVANGTWTVAKK